MSLFEMMRATYTAVSQAKHTCQSANRNPIKKSIDSCVVGEFLMPHALFCKF